MPQGCGLHVPVSTLLLILSDTVARVIPDGEAVGGFGMTTFGGQTITLQGLVAILAYTAPLLVDLTQFVQRSRVSLLRSQPIPVGGHQVVL